MFTNAHQTADARFPEFVRRITELMAIPTVSTDPAYWPDVKRAAGWLVDWLKQIGFERANSFVRDNYLPLVYAEWLGAGPDAQTVLIYSHYDVQPANISDGWSTEPFVPTEVGESLYGRGAVDSKIHVIAQLSAIACMFEAGKPPVNLKILLEGEEESGSEHIFTFVAENPGLLSADVCIVSDGSLPHPDQPVLVYGLRGLIAMEVHVRGPRRDLHSGHYGGSVHNPIQALAEIVTALHDVNGRVTVPGFYDDVALLDDEERHALSGMRDAFVAEWKSSVSAPSPWGEPDYTLHERIAVRPTLEINGMAGGYFGDGFKTVLPGTALAKISCRLVPNQDPAKVLSQVRQHIMSLAPETVTVTIAEVEDGSPGFVVDRNSRAMQAVAVAYERGWGTKPLWSRDGGSIPVVTALMEHLKATIVLMPFGHKEGGAHSQNEHILLPMFRRGIHTMLHFYEALTSG
ncbi:MAG: M20/M25/M40 family metallo-hydrolase [Chloroflexi bacterium]|nr:M20/M25/M40 family metallo-hydrolase [Chloroflexota bacterium]